MGTIVCVQYTYFEEIGGVHLLDGIARLASAPLGLQLADLVVGELETRGLKRLAQLVHGHVAGGLPALRQLQLHKYSGQQYSSAA